MHKFKHRKIFISLLLLLSTGIAVIGWTAKSTNKHMRAELLQQARIAASAINIDHVVSLSASEKDLKTPAYNWIKSQLNSMRKARSQCKYLYLMGQRSDGTVFFFVDSFPKDSKEYVPPGMIYQEVSDSYLRIFNTKQEAVTGPVNDRWGKLITALVPIRLPASGNLAAVLGMDVDARDWNKEIMGHCIGPILVVLLVWVLVLLLAAREETIHALRLSEERFRALFNGMPSGVAVFENTDDGEDFIFTDFNMAAEKIEKINREDVIGKKVTAVFPGVKDLGLFEMLKRVYKTGKSEFLTEALYRDAQDQPSWRENWIYKVVPSHIVTVYNDISTRKNAEIALQQTSDALKLAQQVAKIGSWWYDPETRMSTWTGEMFHIFGLSTRSEALTQEEQRKIIHPDDWDRFDTAFRKAVTDGAGYDLELRITHPNGDARHVNSRCLTRKNEDGVVTQLIGTTQDITDRKLAEEEILKQKIMFETMFDTIPDGVVLTNREREIQLANKGMESTFGYKPKDLLGKSTEILYADKDNYRKSGANVFDENARKTGELYVTLYRDNTGREFPGETFGAKLFDEKNRWIGNLGIMRDITERKQAEKELFESNERFRLLFEKAPLAYQSLDENGNIIEINDTWLDILGYKKEEVIGRNFGKFLHPGSREHFKINFPKFKAVGEILGVELEIVKKDGSSILVSFHGKIAHTLAGSFKQTHCVFRDVTEQKRIEAEKTVLEAKLLQSQKMESIGNLAGGIAHDFNNILSSVIGFAELSLEEVEKGTHLEDNLQEIFMAGKRAKDLVRQILAFARQSGDELKPIQVDMIAAEALKFIRSSIPTTIEIRQTIESDSLIKGNATQVHQVLMNLFTNAAHAMEDEGGILEFSLKDVVRHRSADGKYPDLRPGNYIEIKVSDTGAGIAPDIIGSIFEPYFTTKGPGEGTGMGLAMVHGIVESYGGKILVDSEPGQGTLFTIYLPLARKRHEDHAYRPETLPRGQERILLVDDEASIAKMGRQILEGLGYTVTTRVSSVEAIALFRTRPDDFDLVITDMTMPDLTGDKLTVELIKIRPDIPVILCSGYSKKISDESVAEIGIKAFAYKPIVKADLAKTVRKVLDEAGKKT